MTKQDSATGNNLENVVLPSFPPQHVEPLGGPTLAIVCLLAAVVKVARRKAKGGHQGRPR